MAKRLHYKKHETLPTERIGMVVFILMDNRGKKFTTAELAQRIGLHHQSTWDMLRKLTRTVPICQEVDGWTIY